jgi:hypothetical protein
MRSTFGGFGATALAAFGVLVLVLAGLAGRAFDVD